MHMSEFTYAHRDAEVDTCIACLGVSGTGCKQYLCLGYIYILCKYTVPEAEKV